MEIAALVLLVIAVVAALYLFYRRPARHGSAFGGVAPLAHKRNAVGVGIAASSRYKERAAAIEAVQVHALKDALASGVSVTDSEKLSEILRKARDTA